MPPKKASKKRKASAPTHDELQRVRETEQLFKSNLFRLQTTELLREVTPAYGTPALQGVEAWVRGLRQTLLQLPDAELSWTAGGACSHPHLASCRLHDSKAAFTWQAPAKVDLVGSYLIRTVARPSLNIDMAVQIPTSCLREKDYLDHRYVDKRLLYVAHLAAALRDAGVGEAASLVSLSYAADADWPVLQLRTRGGGNGKAGEEWSVRLIPSLEVGALAPAKLRPARCNLRARAEAPSALYNNRLALESSHAATLALLHSHLSIDVSGAVREAAILLKVWQRQRCAASTTTSSSSSSQPGGPRGGGGGAGGAGGGGGGQGGPSGLQLTLLLLHLLVTRKVTLQMGARRMVKVAVLARPQLASTGPSDRI